MNTLNRHHVTAVLVFFLASCSSTEKDIADAITVKQCDFLPLSIQPNWILGDSQIAGYYTGIGESDARDGHDQALSKAHQNAVAALSSSIKTRISQEVVIKISESTIDGITDQQVDKISSAVTDNSLKNVERDSVWLDRKSCRLWMRVKIARHEVDRLEAEQINQARLGDAIGLYERSRSNHRISSDRLRDIEEAIHLLTVIDFTHLPLEDEQTYEKRFRAQQLDLLGEAGHQTVLIITLSEDFIPQVIHKELAYRLSRGINNSRHLYPSPCADLATCLRYAQKVGARSLILSELRVKLSSSEMGSLLGRVEVDSELYAIETTRLLDQVKGQVGEVLSFNRNNIRWEQAVERMFDGNTSFQRFIQTSLRCSTELC